MGRRPGDLEKAVLPKTHCLDLDVDVSHRDSPNHGRISDKHIDTDLYLDHYVH